MNQNHTHQQGSERLKIPMFYRNSWLLSKLVTIPTLILTRNQSLTITLSRYELDNKRRSGRPIKAAQVLSRVENFHSVPGYQHVYPTIDCYLTVIEGFARSRGLSPHPSRMPQCQAMADTIRMEKQREQNLSSKIEDDPFWAICSIMKCYNACIEAWSRWSGPSNKGVGSASCTLLILR